MEEVKAVIHIARRYHEKGKSFKIITPYDAQRNELETALISSRLPWEDKCFNVDSFQGRSSFLEMGFCGAQININRCM